MPCVAQVQHWPPQMCRILTSSQVTVLTSNQMEQIAEQQQRTAEDEEYWNHLHQCHVSERSKVSVDSASLLCAAVIVAQSAVLVVPSLLCAAVIVVPYTVLVVPSAVSGLESGLQAT